MQTRWLQSQYHVLSSHSGDLTVPKDMFENENVPEEELV